MSQMDLRQREESNPSSLNSEFTFLTIMLYISGEIEIWFWAKFTKVKTCQIRVSLILCGLTGQTRISKVWRRYISASHEVETSNK